MRTEGAIINIPSEYREICANCGCTLGAHHGGTSPWPYNYCPGTEGRMDWDKGPGTVFVGTGKYKRTPNFPKKEPKEGA